MRKKISAALQEILGPLFFMVCMALAVSQTYAVFLEHRYEALAESISADIDNPAVGVRIVGDSVLIEGFASSQSEKSRCEAIAIDYAAAYAAKARIPALATAPKVVNLLSVKI